MESSSLAVSGRSQRQSSKSPSGRVRLAAIIVGLACFPVFSVVAALQSGPGDAAMMLVLGWGLLGAPLIFRGLPASLRASIATDCVDFIKGIFGAMFWVLKVATYISVLILAIAACALVIFGAIGLLLFGIRQL